MSAARRVPLALAALAVLALPAPAADRSHPPAPGVPRPLQFSPVQKLALSNGLPVLIVASHGVPSVELFLVVKAGASSDPLERTGIAAMTADMLDEGAGGRDALVLADAVDYLGAELQTGSSWDDSFVRLHVPVARLAEALPLLADVALRPDFPARELERLQKDTLTSQLQARDDPDEIAARALSKAVFGDAHRYGLPEAGDAKSVAALRIDDLKGFHARHYRPGNAALVVVGDVDNAVAGLVEKAFGSWPAGGVPAPPVPEPPQLRSGSVWLVDKPEAPQSVIRIGRVGPPRATAQYPALETMNTLLGGSFTSRLNDNLREQHGYAYGAGSAFSYLRVAGAFLSGASVQTPSTAESVSEFIKELTRIRTPPSAEETERARNYLALGYANNFETTRQIARQLAGRIVYSLPEDSFASFVPKVLAVTAKDIALAAEAQIDPSRSAIVVVGDRATIEAPLRALKLAPFRVLSVDDVMGPAPKVD
jgi:predicted Zn-dependent peptidase